MLHYILTFHIKQFIILFATIYNWQWLFLHEYIFLTSVTTQITPKRLSLWLHRTQHSQNNQNCYWINLRECCCIFRGQSTAIHVPEYPSSCAQPCKSNIPFVYQRSFSQITLQAAFHYVKIIDFDKRIVKFLFNQSLLSTSGKHLHDITGVGGPVSLASHSL